MTTTVRDLMTTEVETLSPDASLADLIALMDRLHIRHVPIVEEDEVVIGLVSHRDLARGLASGFDDLPMSHQRELLARTTVDMIMVEDVQTIEPDTELRLAAEIMLENKFGCLLVTEGDRLVGIITEADFVRRVLEGLEDE